MFHPGSTFEVLKWFKCWSPPHTRKLPQGSMKHYCESPAQEYPQIKCYRDPWTTKAFIVYRSIGLDFRERWRLAPLTPLLDHQKYLVDFRHNGVSDEFFRAQHSVSI